MAGKMGHPNMHVLRIQIHQSVMYIVAMVALCRSLHILWRILPRSILPAVWGSNLCWGLIIPCKWHISKRKEYIQRVLPIGVSALVLLAKAYLLLMVPGVFFLKLRPSCCHNFVPPFPICWRGDMFFVTILANYTFLKIKTSLVDVSFSNNHFYLLKHGSSFFSWE